MEPPDREDMEMMDMKAVAEVGALEVVMAVGEDSEAEVEGEEVGEAVVVMVDGKSFDSGFQCCLYVWHSVAFALEGCKSLSIRHRSHGNYISDMCSSSREYLCHVTMSSNFCFDREIRI